MLRPLLGIHTRMTYSSGKEDCGRCHFKFSVSGLKCENDVPQFKDGPLGFLVRTHICHYNKQRAGVPPLPLLHFKWSQSLMKRITYFRQIGHGDWSQWKLALFHTTPNSVFFEKKKWPLLSKITLIVVVCWVETKHGWKHWPKMRKNKIKEENQILNQSQITTKKISTSMPPCHEPSAVIRPALHHDKKTTHWPLRQTWL